MSSFRQYMPEPLSGTPVKIGTIAERRALLGRRIEWHSGGYVTKSAGLVEGVKGKNMRVDGDWKWAPNMKNVHVLEDTK